MRRRSVLSVFSGVFNFDGSHMAMILPRGGSCHCFVLFGFLGSPVFEGLSIPGEEPRFFGFTDLKFFIVLSRSVLLSFLYIFFSSSSRGCGKCGELLKSPLGKA
jgi:hypothetical protein